jgi:hypothetical protein
MIQIELSIFGNNVTWFAIGIIQILIYDVSLILKKEMFFFGLLNGEIIAKAMFRYH